MARARLEREIDPEDAIEKLPGLVEVGQSADELISACLELLLHLGFDRARYYEIDENDPDNGAICVLTHHLPVGSEPLHGYTIPLEETALQRLGAGKAVVLANNRSMDPSAAWETDLGLRDRVSVDIPVAAGGTTIGLLAADCEPGRVALNDKGRSVLSVLGAIAGSASTAVSNRPLEPHKSEVQPTDMTPDEYAGYAGLKLSNEVDAEVAAVFRYNWRRGRLEKIREWYMGNEVSIAEFPETYARDEHLTGTAWANPDVRYVPDFARLNRNRPGLVSTGSLEWYSSRLQHDIKTVLYTVLGRSEGRYLVRVFNRRQDPLLPYLNLRTRFNALSEVLSLGLDDLIARRRLLFLARTARAGVANVTKPSKVIELGVAGLDDEGLQDFVFVSQVAGSRRPGLVFAGGRYKGLQQGIAEMDLPADILLDTIAGEPGVVLSNEALSMHLPEVALRLKEIRAQITPTESEQFSCFSAKAGDVRALLLARVPAAVGKRAPSVALPPSALDVTQTLVTMFAEAVESKYSHLTVRGARHALGYIGHELGTPLAILGDAAIAAVMTTLEEAQRFEDGREATILRARLRRYYERVQESRGATNSALRLAPLIVQVGEGALDMFMARESVADLVRAARGQVSFKTRNRQSWDSGLSSQYSSRYTIDIGASVDRLGDIVCDRYLIRQLLVNVLDNAVKYSLPRWASRNEDMVISVSGRRVGTDLIDISIQNWGHRIESKNSAEIFEAFVRGEQEDRLKVIRGMGLGLYLSRLIATAHKGSLDFRLEEGRNETDSRLDAALTTFTLRLPSKLPIGPRRFTWNEGTAL